MNVTGRWTSVLGLVLTGASLSVGAQPADRNIVLMTTTSVRDAGLLQVLIPPFEEASGYAVRVVAVGTGQAIALARQGEADLLIVHDPEAEERFIGARYGVRRWPMMRNAFAIVGPRDDPAGVRDRGPVEAFRDIATARVRFVSRDDGSGTHSREQRLWQAAGIRPAGGWYLGSGQGMAATLEIAHELGAYALTDLATFLTHARELQLALLVSGDPLLDNRYDIIDVNPERFAWLNEIGAAALRDYLLSGPVQARIASFGRREFGRSLFRPVHTSVP